MAAGLEINSLKFHLFTNDLKEIQIKGYQSSILKESMNEEF